MADPPHRLAGLLVGGHEGGDARGDDGSAVIALEQTAFTQVVEIFANGLRCHLETSGQALDVDPALFARDAHNFLLPGRDRMHLSILVATRLVARNIRIFNI